MQYTMF